MDDLRAAKHIVLTALALNLAAPRDNARLRRYLGHPALTPADAATLRTILINSGARDTTERMITTRYHRALHALTAAALPAPVATALRAIAHHATARPA